MLCGGDYGRLQSLNEKANTLRKEAIVKPSHTALMAVMVLTGVDSLRAQSFSVHATAGYAATAGSENSDMSEWGSGWMAGVGGEFRLIGLVGLTGHIQYHSFAYDGTEIEPGATLVSQDGDALGVLEFSLGARVYLGPFFIAGRVGQYSKNFGEVRITSTPSGQTTPSTSTTQRPSVTDTGVDLGMGLMIELPIGISISPQVHIAMVPRLNSSIVNIGVAGGMAL